MAIRINKTTDQQQQQQQQQQHSRMSLTNIRLHYAVLSLCFVLTLRAFDVELLYPNSNTNFLTFQLYDSPLDKTSTLSPSSSKRKNKFHYWNETNGINATTLSSYLDWFVGNGQNERYGWNNFPLIPFVITKKQSNNETVSYQVGYSMTALKHCPTWRFFLRDRVEPLVKFISTALNSHPNLEDSPTTGRHDWKRLYQVLDSGTVLPFLVDISDEHYCGKNYFKFQSRKFDLPIFAMARRVNCHHVFPIPTFLAIRHAKETAEEWDENFNATARLYPWTTKLNSAIWRGSNSGKHRPSPYNRKWLEQCSAQSNGLIDAKIIANNNKKYAVQFEDFQKHKSIYDIDGNGWSGRFLRLLCMNSVVIKLQPEAVDYNMDEFIKPWVHYIPANHTLSSLTDQVRFVNSPENEKNVKEIIQNANNWCRNNLIWSSQRKDFLDIFASFVNELDQNVGDDERTDLSYSSSSWEQLFEHERKNLDFQMHEGAHI